jgi:hypothetical protein
MTKSKSKSKSNSATKSKNKTQKNTKTRTVYHISFGDTSNVNIATNLQKNRLIFYSNKNSFWYNSWSEIIATNKEDYPNAKLCKIQIPNNLFTTILQKSDTPKIWKITPTNWNNYLKILQEIYGEITEKDHRQNSMQLLMQKYNVFGIDKTNTKLYKKINEAEKQLNELTPKYKNRRKHLYLAHSADEGYFLPQDELGITIDCRKIFD